MQKLANICEIFAGLLLLVLCFLTMSDVVGRQFLDSPIAAAGSLSELLLASIVMLAMPRVSIMGHHLAVDILTRIFTPWQHVVIRVFSGVLGTATFSLMAWRFADYAQKQGRYGTRVAQIGLPVSYVYWGLVVLSIITALAFLVFAIRKSNQSPSTEGH